MNMRLLRAELGKIWRPWPILAALGVCGVVLVFAQSYTGYTHGHSVLDSAESFSAYGPVYTKDVAELMAARLEQAQSTYNADIREAKGSASRGITDDESYSRWLGDLYDAHTGDNGAVDMDSVSDADQSYIHTIETLPSNREYTTLNGNSVQGPYTRDALYEQLESQAESRLSVETTTDPAQAAESEETHVVCSQTSCTTSGDGGDGTTPMNKKRDPLPGTVSARISQIADHFDSLSTLQLNIVSGAQELSPLMMIASVLSALLLTMSLLTRDRQRRVTALQWASKTGRGTRGAQVAAIGMSALATGWAVSAGFALWFLLPLWKYRDFGMSSAQSVPLSWFDWTLGQYLTAVSLSAGVLAMALTLVATAVFRAQPNAIRLLLMAVPTGAAAVFVGNVIWGTGEFGSGIYTMDNPVNRPVPIPGIEAIIIAALLLLGAGIWLALNRRLKHSEFRYA